MIRPRYAFKLARTKLHSKRGMLFASIVISSLLFATLFAAIITFSGIEKSAVEFVRKANDDRYLVEVQPVIPDRVFGYSLPLSLEDVNRIRTLEKNYYSTLREKYKKLGITYDRTEEIPALRPSAFLPPTLPEKQRVEVNYQSPVIELDKKQRLEAYVASAKNKLTDLKAIADQFGATRYYTSDRLDLAGTPNMLLIQNDRERFENSNSKSGDLGAYGYFTNAIHNGSYAFEDEDLLRRYLLPFKQADLKGIPVVVSAQEAVSLFGKDKGIGEEPKDPLQKAAWLKEVQAKMNGHTYQACYRNTVEMEKIEKVQRDYAEIAANKEDPDYIKPSLIYDLPKSPCGDVVIKEDTRTAAEKQAEAAAVENKKKLGTYQAPLRQLLTFQITGIVNAQPPSRYTENLQSYLKNLLGTENVMSSAIIPRQAYESLPASAKLDTLEALQKNSGESFQELAGLESHILAFPTIDSARAFMNQETCPTADTECAKPFKAAAYGSNYLILDEAGKFFRQLMTYLLPVIFGLALVIIWFTLARIMAENRKEIAVYRAMGATRGAIAAIYVLYVGIIAFWIALISLLVGLAVAYGADRMYSAELTNVATLSLGNVAESMRFSLYDVSLQQLWIVCAAIFVVSIIASLQPLIRSVLRPPINDIRSE